MSESIPVSPKRRGRPPEGGRDPIVPIRMPNELREALDAWIDSEPDLQRSRSEAIRKALVDQLSVKGFMGNQSGRMTRNEESLIDWISEQPDPQPSRSQAIDRILELFFKEWARWSVPLHRFVNIGFDLRQAIRTLRVYMGSNSYLDELEVTDENKEALEFLYKYFPELPPRKLYWFIKAVINENVDSIDDRILGIKM